MVRSDELLKLQYYLAKLIFMYISVSYLLVYRINKLDELFITDTNDCQNCKNEIWVVWIETFPLNVLFS